MINTSKILQLIRIVDKNTLSSTYEYLANESMQFISMRDRVRNSREREWEKNTGRTSVNWQPTLKWGKYRIFFSSYSQHDCFQFRLRLKKFNRRKLDGHPNREEKKKHTHTAYIRTREWMPKKRLIESSIVSLYWVCSISFHLICGLFFYFFFVFRLFTSHSTSNEMRLTITSSLLLVAYTVLHKYMHTAV